jgi:deoxyribodipyrimidine photo-lyase
MIAARRVAYNFALDRAIAWAKGLDQPLVILEALRIGYSWASDRLHRFVIEGMADNAEKLEGSGALYYPYLERQHGEGKGLLAALAARASVVVTDEFPCFFLPRMVDAAVCQVRTRFEQVDSNGLVPLRATDRAFPTAFAFRRFLQEVLPDHIGQGPRARPFAAVRLRRASIPKEIRERWPPVPARGLAVIDLSAWSIDHRVAPARFRGGSRAASTALRRFLDERLPRYREQRNEPSLRGTSELSPYLHFGHISVHEVLARLARREGWSLDKIAPNAHGKRVGYWRMSPDAEAFLDQIVTWRELGYNMCHKRSDYDDYDSLPAWARTTLAAHQRDRRPRVYTLDQLEAAGTHDRLWNAAQGQLVRDGWFPQLHAHALGKENLGMEPFAARRPRGDDRADEQVLARWPQPELVRGLLLDAGSLRSTMGPGAAHLRNGALHELRKRAPQARPRSVHRRVRPLELGSRPFPTARS